MRAIIIGASILVFALVAPYIFYPLFLMKALCFALFVAAFNLLIGYVGIFSFGHAMFFGIAAYATGHAIKIWQWPTEAGVLLGVLVGACLGLVTGLIAIRRHGIYFAMVTLALAQMAYFFCMQAALTGGEDGLQDIPRRPLFGALSISDNVTLYYVILAIVILGFFAIFRIIQSPFGRVLRAIHQNEQRAISLGYEVNRYKIIALVLSAAFSGLSGSMKVIVFQLATLSDVGAHLSFEVVLMTLLGGIGTFAGPIFGSFFVLGLQNYLSGIGEWIEVIQGLIFICVILLFRKGFVGEVIHGRLKPLGKLLGSRES